MLEVGCRNKARKIHSYQNNYLCGDHFIYTWGLQVWFYKLKVDIIPRISSAIDKNGERKEVTPNNIMSTIITIILSEDFHTAQIIKAVILEGCVDEKLRWETTAT